MEAMVSSLKPPTCATVKCSRGPYCKPCDKTSGIWPFCLRPRPSRTRLQVECAASGLQEMKPLQASKLQEEFGSENLRFSDVSGRTVVELKMNSGTSARLLLQEARITSYNCRLWHGSLEEFLYTDVTEFNAEGSNDSDDGIIHGETPQQFTVTGGMSPSLVYCLDPHLSLFDNNWSIQSVEVDPDEHVQVTLKCVNEDRGGWHFKLHNVITLTNEGLAFALLLTNKDRKPLMFTASVSTHLAIRSTKAISCVGLDGCDYYSPSEAAIKGAQDNSFFGKLKRFVLPFQLDESKGKGGSDEVKGMDEMSEDSDEDDKHWFVEKPGDLVSLANGVHKLYSDPPNRMRVTDEGFRRSLVFENHGFENLEVWSPEADGEKPFLSIGFGTVLSSITLNKGEHWRGALILAPDTK